MSNEEIVDQIRHGFSVTSNMERLYTQNLPLLRRFVKPYLHLEDETDLLQECYFGLWQAVQNYESSANVRFMTFAQFWVKHQIQRYLEESGSIIRLPAHLRQQMGRYKKTVQQLQQEFGRDPTDSEVAQRMGISPERVQRIQLCAYGVVSLDAPIPTDSNDEDYTLADGLADDSSLENDAIDRWMREYWQNELWAILGHFTDELQRDLLKRYAAGQTIAQIARETGESYAKVRSRLNDALRRLRTGRPGRELRERIEVISSNVFRGGLKSYREHDDTSIVERIAVERAELSKHKR